MPLNKVSGGQGTYRQWELGVLTEAQMRKEATSTEPQFYSCRLVRSICGEFLGCMLFLFLGMTVARFSGERAEDDPASDQSATNLLISATFGLSIFVLVYVLAEVSGAHLNPAVSFGLVVGKRISVERFFIYLACQVAGAIAGAGVATSTFFSSTAHGVNSIATGVSAGDAFGAEVMCTFVLMVTVLAACDEGLGRKTAHTAPFLPVAIGAAVFLAHLVLIPIDGCSINPARSMAAAVATGEWDDHWVFWVGPMVGGALGTVVWEGVLRPDQVVEDRDGKSVPLDVTALI